jgi:hypothetical protein
MAASIEAANIFGQKLCGSAVKITTDYRPSGQLVPLPVIALTRRSGRAFYSAAQVLGTPHVIFSVQKEAARTW